MRYALEMYLRIEGVSKVPMVDASELLLLRLLRIKFIFPHRK